MTEDLIVTVLLNGRMVVFKVKLCTCNF